MSVYTVTARIENLDRQRRIQNAEEKDKCLSRGPLADSQRPRLYRNSSVVILFELSYVTPGILYFRVVTENYGRNTFSRDTE